VCVAGVGSCAILSLVSIADELVCACVGTGLRITDDELVPLLSLGFSATESRIGLRYCNRELERTVDFLYERRSRLQEQRSFNQRKRRFGKTSQGNYVDLTTLDCTRERV